MTKLNLYEQLVLVRIQLWSCQEFSVLLYLSAKPLTILPHPFMHILLFDA